MEILAQLNSIPEGIHVGIIPTVLLPFAILSTGISVVATFIAGLFGVKLRAEGPKKLLEVLLKPKILITALIFNALIYGGMQGWQYIKHGPVPAFYQNLRNRNSIATNSAKSDIPGLHWQQNVEEGLFADGIIIGNELYAGSKEGSLYVFNLKSGALTHRIYIGKFIAPALTHFKGHLYFGEGLHHSHHMGIYKFDLKTKKIVGKFKTKGHTEAQVIATTFKGEDYLFFSAGGDGLYAVDPKTMTKRWHYLNGHMDSHPIIQDGAIYIGTGTPLEDMGKTRPLGIKLDLTTGKELWAQELPLSSWFGPIALPEAVCFPLGEIHIKSSLGGYQCFNFAGERTKNIFVDSPVMGKQKLVNGKILFNDFKGTVHYWDYQSEAVLWEIDNSSTKYSFSSSQKVDEKHYLFFNRTGDGVIFDIEEGKVLSKMNFNKDESVFADPIVHKDGFIILGLKGTLKNYKKKI